MRYFLVVFIGWIGCCSVSYGAFDSTSTKGNCSPIVSGEVGGNVTITCEGLSEGAIKTLNELLNKVGEVKDLNNLVLEKLGSLDKIEPQLADANTKLAKLLADQSGDKTTIQSLNQMIGMLNKEKSQLEGDIKALNTGIETVKLKAAEDWAQRFRELKEQLIRLEQQIAKIDGESNAEARKVLSSLRDQAQMVLENGQLDEAGRLYDELIAKVKEQRNKLKDQLEKQIELMDDLEANASHQRGQVYLLQYQPLQALPFLESAYRLRPASKVYAHAYALLLQNQNQHAQAITIYEQSLQRLQEAGDKEYVAATLNNLGNLYQVTQGLKEGEVSLQEALAIYRDLAKANPQAYLSYVAATLNNLGALYYQTQRFKEGEASYQEALTIRRDLAKANPQAYLPDVVMTLNNLGNLYYKTQRFEEGEASYQEALTICRELAKVNPQAHLTYVAGTLSNLGVLYKNTQRLKEAETSYQEALTIRRDLAKANPQAYLPDVAMTLNNLGLLYSNTQRFKEGEASYQETLTIYRDLAKANPQAYLPDVARTLNNLGVLYKNTQRLKEGEASYQEALTTYRDLAKANPQAYLSYVAGILNNLGNLYSDTQRFEEGEASYQEALTTYRDLAKANPQVYRKDLADTLFKIALSYFEQGKTVEIRPYIDEAVTLYRELWQAHPELYAEQFWAGLILNAFTFPQEEIEKRCALLKEAWQVASSEEDKTAVLDADKAQGGHCKFPSPEK